MALTNWLPTPKFEDYKEFFKEHFEMERREDGVLFVCMHTLGGEVQWNAQLHRAIWQLFRTIGSDPENEVLIFTAKGGHWMRGFDTESWAEIEEPTAGGDQKRATYENMFYDGRNMLISLIHDIEFPTICAFPGFGFQLDHIFPLSPPITGAEFYLLNPTAPAGGRLQFSISAAAETR